MATATPPATSPTRVTAPPSPMTGRRARLAELTALKSKGNARTPADTARLIDLLVDELASRPA